VEGIVIKSGGCSALQYCPLVYYSEGREGIVRREAGRALKYELGKRRDY
jgi:hypothetical protein